MLDLLLAETQIAVVGWVIGIQVIPRSWAFSPRPLGSAREGEGESNSPQPLPCPHHLSFLPDSRSQDLIIFSDVEG